MAQSAVFGVRPSIADLLFAGVLAVVFALQAHSLAVTTSGTPDETTYLRAGLNIYHRGEFAALADDGIAPLPVLLSFAAPALFRTSGYARQILVARTSAILLIGVPFILIVYLSLRHGCGRAAATVGTSLIAFSPNFIGHAALATTDICFVAAGLSSLLALIRYVEQRSSARLAWLAAALAGALSAKYSAIALFPATAVVLLLTDRERNGLRRVTDALAVTVVLFMVALVAAWALHGFALAPTKIAALGSRRVPAALAGILSQAQHQRGGHPAFLLGRTSSVGWWYYMPVALALKSTPSELVIIAAALVLVLATAPTALPSALTWRIALLTFSMFALVNRLDLGVRYVLILVPLFLFVAVERCRRRMPAVAMTVVCALLLFAQIASARAIAPHYLSYFNRLVGGPAAGYRYLADSNVDWGQDLPALRDALAHHRARRTLVSYFGNAPFAEYGVAADVWDGNVQRDFESWDWVAISATHLDGLFVPADVFAPFRDLAPSDRAGYSILMYATSRSDVRAAMAETARRWREAR
jgi:4-amino-4-deoxy-L-arabinose transferase-like glycosyltransferase